MFLEYIDYICAMKKVYLTKDDYDYTHRMGRLRQQYPNDYSYSKDSRVGDIGEKIIIQLLIDYGWTIISCFRTNLPTGELKKFDIVASNYGKIRKFEVKLDLKAYPGKYERVLKMQHFESQLSADKDTGNGFIEISCEDENGIQQDSGVIATTSDYFITIYVFIGEIWVNSPTRIINLAKEYNWSVFSGGDLKKTRGWLFKREYFEKYFKIKKFELKINDE